MAKVELFDDELKMLDELAQGTIAYLVVFGVASFFTGAYALAVCPPFPSGQPIFPPVLLIPTALFGFSGSAVAALTSCLDRYALGFERENGKPFPESAKEGQGRFNRRFSRWLFVRPFLGAVIGPVFIWGLGLFVRNPEEWTATLGFTAFMGGLLAKSVVDLIKSVFKNVFKA